MKYLRCLLHSWAPRPGRWCGGHLLWRRAEASRARWFSGSPARDLKPQLPSPGCSPGLRWWCLLPEEGGEEKEKSLFCSKTHKQRASLQDTLQQSAPFFMQVSWRHACDAGEVSSGAKQLENTKSCSQTHESVTGPVVGCGARQCDKLYTVHDRQHLHTMTAGSGRIHRSQTHLVVFTNTWCLQIDTGKNPPTWTLTVNGAVEHQTWHSFITHIHHAVNNPKKSAHQSAQK